MWLPLRQTEMQSNQESSEQLLRFCHIVALHGAVVADVGVVRLVPAAALRTLVEAAANAVGRGPHQLRVVAHQRQVVAVRAVGEVVLLQVPRLDGEVPAAHRTP